MDENNGSLIKNVIKGKVETYYLVTKRDLDQIKINSIISDVLFLAGSLGVSDYLASTPKRNISLFAGLTSLAISFLFYYFKHSIISETEKSGELEEFQGSTKPTKKGMTNQSGLKVIKAYYGTGEVGVDITGRVRNLIKNNHLIVMATNDLAGQDPMPGVVKHLEIEYELGGLRVTKRYREGEQINI